MSRTRRREGAGSHWLMVRDSCGAVITFIKVVHQQRIIRQHRLKKSVIRPRLRLTAQSVSRIAARSHLTSDVIHHPDDAIFVQAPLRRHMTLCEDNRISALARTVRTYSNFEKAGMVQVTNSLSQRPTAACGLSGDTCNRGRCRQIGGMCTCSLNFARSNP